MIYNKNENGEIVLNEEIVKKLIQSKNIYFSHPVTMNKGVYKITNLKQMHQTAKEYGTSTWDGDWSCDEFFTYWDLENDKPLFDIHIEKDLFNPNICYTLSNNSLFGMIWFKDNSLPVSMKNVIDNLKLDVPDVDMQKYTENNFKKATINFDFLKKE